MTSMLFINPWINKNAQQQDYYTTKTRQKNKREE